MRSHDRFAAIRGNLMLLAVWVFFWAGLTSAASNDLDVNGTWETEWGPMVLTQTGTSVHGTYIFNNGDISGTLMGNVLEGYWTQDSSAHPCTGTRNGRRHWGRIRFVFDSDQHFSGLWGWCDQEPANYKWNGKRQAGPARKHEIDPAGTWNTTKGTMTLKCKGTSVSGTYGTHNGRISGTVYGRLLEGTWVQDDGDQRCQTPLNGSFYWGHLRFEFDDAGGFSGIWGYCDQEPAGTDWHGKRLKDQ